MSSSDGGERVGSDLFTGACLTEATRFGETSLCKVKPFEIYVSSSVFVMGVTSLTLIDVFRGRMAARTRTISRVLGISVLARSFRDQGFIIGRTLQYAPVSRSNPLGFHVLARATFCDPL